MAEVYSPPRIVTVAEAAGLRGGFSLDLTTPYMGERWDFTKKSCREKAMELVRQDKPYLLIGSPPCTKFSILQNLVRGKGLTHEQRDKFERDLAQAVKHVNFCVKLYHRQRVRGRYYLHEHPLTATIWQVPSMKTITSRQDNYIAESQMCAFGMTTVDPEHGILPAKKPTRFVSNDLYILRRLAQRCQGDHAHARLE